MSVEPESASVLDRNFVSALAAMLNSWELKWDFNHDMSLALDKSKMQRQRSGTPPICDTDDFAHLTWPVLLHVVNNSVRSKHDIKLALVFNNRTNRISVEFMFGENSTSTTDLEFDAPFHMAGIETSVHFGSHVSNIGIGNRFTVDCENLERPVAVQDVNFYAHTAARKIEDCARQLCARIYEHMYSGAPV